MQSEDAYTMIPVQNQVVRNLQEARRSDLALPHQKTQRALRTLQANTPHLT